MPKKNGARLEQMTICLPPDVRAYVRQCADRDCRTVSEQVRHFVTEAARRANRTSHSPPSAWISQAKDRLAAMRAEKARLERIETADAEAGARQLCLDIDVLSRELAVAERLLAPSDGE